MDLFRRCSGRMRWHGQGVATAALLCTILTGILAPPSASAGGLEDGIDAFLRDWEGQMTSGSPNFFQGQQRGHLFGGSLDMRFPNRTPAPLTLSLPRVKSGCGGISFFGGAFSFINMEQFTQYLQAIAQNALGMAFNMALTTLCPQCATVLSKLEDTVRNMTGNLASSCQAARGLLSQVGLSPDKLSGLAAQNCTAINNTLGLSEDWFDGALNCSQEGKVADAENRAKQDYFSNPQRLFQPPLFNSGNVFWQAWQRVAGGLPEYTEEFGEQLMSLFGTVVVNLTEGEGGSQNYAPKLTVHDLIEGWSEDKQTYGCDEYALCLHVSTGFPPAYEGLAKRIEGALWRYADNVQRREKDSLSPYLTSNIIGLPVARLIINTSAIPGGNDRVISFAAKYLAAQILQAYVKQLGQVIDAEVRRVKDAGHVATFLDQFTFRRREIQEEFVKVHQDLSNGLRDLQAFVTLVQASQGVNSSMFSRHTTFSRKIIQNAHTVGR